MFIPETKVEPSFSGREKSFHSAIPATPDIFLIGGEETVRPIHASFEFFYRTGLV